MVRIILILLLIVVIDNSLYRREGIVTHYGYGFHLIRSGASGIKVDATLPLAASREIPYGTIVEVENIDKTSRCLGNRVRVMVFDWGPEAEPHKRIFDMMPDGGFYSYRGRPGIAEKGRGGIKVKLTIVDTSYTCVPERLGNEKQSKGEYFCLRRKFGKAFLTYDDIFWNPWFFGNKECYEEKEKEEE